MSTAFTPAWLAGDPAAAGFVPLDFRRPRDRAQAVAQAARPVPPAVLEALHVQEARRPHSASRHASLEALASPGTIAVVTGQQAGLFLGPLYTLYKAASAIVTAAALEAESGRRCVPVFWLATEDHDWPEIDHCVVPTPEGPRRITIADTLGPGAERVSVAHRRLDDVVGVALGAMADSLGTLPQAEAVVALLRRHYRPDATPGEALGGALAELFADHGLVVIDPRDPALAAAAAPTHRHAITNARPIAAALEARAVALAEAGFAVQVHVRQDAPLSFVHPDGPAGPRFRMTLRPDHRYGLVGDDRTVTEAELLAWLDTDPARLSTSALLRPILQDRWLPTAAYVGGPGEIAYFAELAPLYDAFDLPMPLIVPRARFRLVDDRAGRLLDQLGLAPADLDLPHDQLLGRLGAAREGQPDPDGLTARWLGPLRDELRAFEAAAGDLDKGLAKATAKTDEAIAATLERLVDRYRRTLARQDEVTRGRLERLEASLRPGGAPQERVYGWPWFAARYGIEELTRLVVDGCEPWTTATRELRP